MKETIINSLKKIGLGLAVFIVTAGGAFLLTWGFYKLNHHSTSQSATSTSKATSSSKKKSVKTSGSASKKAPSATESTTSTTYLVQAGDTGASIAAAHNMTLSELTKLNPKVTWSALKAGATIKVANNASADTAAASTTTTTTASTKYVVQAGDTWYRIAYNNGMTTAQLKALNPGVTNLKSGTTINISQ
ncbi:LysM peptidoglycan-binding domain-containing protein [Weissella diestrammenae]|uniref:LysM peptidoglycan-binding domain-containing protein n=1 Tax=Weissella diestrammenae TaxID=1162633 RepID=A0A7G9T697_9LACO|nr:LysM domain-containing protein [Weissella diestrammenae]MCM0583332.1 LysM peptidoglycan-binding domain-containing protein [Weissella diestrammenae]QNN75622.1 LysM peptidoglycan-binding domain-containing protein [Weissella diestrammenae]